MSSPGKTGNFLKFIFGSKNVLKSFSIKNARVTVNPPESALIMKKRFNDYVWFYLFVRFDLEAKVLC